jgi:threonine/homoserine/homoserine lactone efflux protein
MFLRGVLIGFAIAAPVGPIGVLCIRRTLAYGRLSGFVSGLGAATADAVYGSIAAVGLTAVAGFLVEQRAALQWMGGFILLYLGLRTMFDRPRPLPVAPSILPEQGRSSLQWRVNCRVLIQDFGSTFLLTLTNPMTILSFTAILAGLGAARVMEGGFQIVMGIFTGSTLWWLTLSLSGGILRGWLAHAGRLRWVNWISGSIILAYGVIALVDLAWKR